MQTLCGPLLRDALLSLFFLRAHTPSQTHAHRGNFYHTHTGRTFIPFVLLFSLEIFGVLNGGKCVICVISVNFEALTIFAQTELSVSDFAAPQHHITHTHRGQAAGASVAYFSTPAQHDAWLFRFSQLFLAFPGLRRTTWRFARCSATEKPSRFLRNPLTFGL